MINDMKEADDVCFGEGQGPGLDTHIAYLKGFLSDRGLMPCDNCLEDEDKCEGCESQWQKTI